MPSEYNREIFGGEMIAMVYHRHDEGPKMRPCADHARESASTSSFTWRLGSWGRIGM
jgi:hypothetical protein